MSTALQLQPPATKRCPKCGTVKNRDEFGANRHRADGLNGWCRGCIGRWYQENRSDHIAKVIAWTRSNPSARKEISRRYCASHILEMRARSAVSEAVANGTLPAVRTQTCIGCGLGAEEYHHHNGYAVDHRLDVVAMCVRCHERSHHSMCVGKV
jgi:predicted Fe-S protein YdhL (DUF1289 family)